MPTPSTWGADTPVSLPVPMHADDVAYVDFGGFAMTEFGISHNFRETDLEEYLPSFAPQSVD